MYSAFQKPCLSAYTDILPEVHWFAIVRLTTHKSKSSSPRITIFRPGGVKRSNCKCLVNITGIIDFIIAIFGTVKNRYVNQHNLVNKVHCIGILESRLRSSSVQFSKHRHSTYLRAVDDSASTYLRYGQLNAVNRVISKPMPSNGPMNDFINCPTVCCNGCLGITHLKMPCSSQRH